MNRLLLLLFGIGVLTLSTAIPVQAEEVLTDLQVETIRVNCTDAQNSLNRLHSSDGLMRVSIGRRYDAMNSKLMMPMNSRISLNKLDPVNLVTITSKYTTLLDEFRSQYRAYEQELSAALALNCTNQPVTFYDTVKLAREKRQVLHATTVKLNAYLKEYAAKFDEFATTIPSEGHN